MKIGFGYVRIWKFQDFGFFFLINDCFRNEVFDQLNINVVWLGLGRVVELDVVLGGFVLVKVICYRCCYLNIMNKGSEIVWEVYYSSIMEQLLVEEQIVEQEIRIVDQNSRLGQQIRIVNQNSI